jgi:hypothetical protein
VGARSAALRSPKARFLCSPGLALASHELLRDV